MTEKIKYENWDFENPAEFTADFIANGFKALSRSGTTDEQVDYANRIVDFSILNHPVTDIFANDPQGIPSIELMSNQFLIFCFAPSCE